MSKETKSDITTTKGKSFAEAAKEVKSPTDREHAQGFRGVEVDPTPNEAYTVKGVTSGMPTPETDVKAAQEARGVTGLGLSALEWQANEKAKGGAK